MKKMSTQTHENSFCVCGTYLNILCSSISVLIIKNYNTIKDYKNLSYKIRLIGICDSK